MSKFELYLGDILRAIKLMEESAKNKSLEGFKTNRESVDAAAMRLQIIGESIKKLPEKLRIKHKKVEWNKYLRTRNIISHAYFAINPEILWSIIIKDLPKLKKEIRNILENEK